MREYDIDTFRQYYQGSYIRDPRKPDRVLSLAFHEDDNGRRKCVGLDAVGAAVDVDFRTLEWHHVRRPALGYRHTRHGSRLFHACINRRSDTAKGFNTNCVSVTAPQEFLDAVKRLENPPDTRVIINHEIVSAYFFPEFIADVPGAVDILKNDARAIALAINPKIAVCLGVSADAAFVILMEGEQIAHSNDGENWQFKSNVAERILCPIL